ncbi:hypothetical protein DICPUDRAFT_34083 [Dictyostelium purpureum]|uniref:UbiA prenyltransferase family protein n=1 Tax=Dictyostelium purpureum TaxID=5786 RepID=F0ZM01_DICPU|nr:uncharacterized protein DICPUDRAFT_34083 [Dictyostelium purpureum]EGC35015.1 hypothetical protein DICPUDRAFT_34083 [Dictyostelium purpureum]|eukprot:XP_003288443.1 hypothetical protein DICPUDRAFT_34083 [Dictyostelium purpureum]
MNVINKYLISTRSYLSTGILFILLTSSSIAYSQTKTLDLKFSFFCFTIIFQNFCFAYLLNSYLEYFIYGSETTKRELDSTLFRHISKKQLRDFIKFPLICNGILLMVTFKWKGSDAFFTILILDLLQILGVCLYTPLKYYALGHIIFSLVHYINIWIFYYANTKSLPIDLSFTSPNPFIYYSFYFLPVILQSIHANYHRDIEIDKKHGVVTIAIILGKNFSLYYYYLLYIGGLLYLVFLMLKFNNLFFLLPFATIPLMNNMYSRVKNGDYNLLNVQTTKTHFFSLFLFSIAILLVGKK